MIVPWEAQGIGLGLSPAVRTGHAPLWDPLGRGATVRVGRLLLQLGVSVVAVVGWLAVTGRERRGGE